VLADVLTLVATGEKEDDHTLLSERDGTRLSKTPLH
jgi:hypothetical protein